MESRVKKLSKARKEKLKSVNTRIHEIIEQISSQLTDCGLDTEGMRLIVDRLRSL